MYLRVDRHAFAAGLQGLVKIFNRKSPLQILDTVYLRMSGGTLVMVATDTTYRVSYAMTAEGDLNTCVNRKALLGLVQPEKNSNGEDIEMRQEDDSLTITIEGQKARLSTIEPEGFSDGLTSIPVDMSPAEDQHFVMPIEELSRALEYISCAASQDPTRQSLHGIYVDGTNAVTTDGHRLHIYPLACTMQHAYIIPAPVARMLKLLPIHGTIDFRIEKGECYITDERWRIQYNTMHQEYPDYMVFTKRYRDTSIHFKTDTVRLEKLLTKAMKIAGDEDVTIWLKTTGEVSCGVSNAELGDMEFVLPTSEAPDLDRDFKVGARMQYLLDALPAKAIRGKCPTTHVHFNSDLGPIRILTGNCFAFVMPIRL